jgi:hypothetical protein
MSSTQRSVARVLRTRRAQSPTERARQLRVLLGKAFVAEVPMRRLCLVLALAAVGLASGCGSSPPPPAQTTVVVPPGSTVVCPNGTAAVYSGGTYRC